MNQQVLCRSIDYGYLWLCGIFILNVSFIYMIEKWYKLFILQHCLNKSKWTNVGELIYFSYLIINIHYNFKCFLVFLGRLRHTRSRSKQTFITPSNFPFSLANMQGGKQPYIDIQSPPTKTCVGCPKIQCWDGQEPFVIYLWHDAISKTWVKHQRRHWYLPWTIGTHCK